MIIVFLDRQYFQMTRMDDVGRRERGFRGSAEGKGNPSRNYMQMMPMMAAAADNLPAERARE